MNSPAPQSDWRSVMALVTRPPNTPPVPAASAPATVAPPPVRAKARRPGGRSGPLTGAVWAEFEVGDLLGAGGMGEVYLAREPALDRLVALKVMALAMAADPDQRRRWGNEARALASLDSPHIVRVLTTGEEAERPYLAMELLEGGTLAQAIAGLRQAGSTHAPLEALELTLQAARGLAFAHATGLVHRDIKPGNLMFDGAGQLKVVDFGLVRFASETTMTVAGATLGTPQYMAPEQCRGEAADARSDLYGLGCVLYEMLTGAPPFTAETAETLMFQHGYSEPPLPRDLVPTIPPGLEAVCLKCLQKDPARRFPDANALIADLERLRAGLAPLSALFPSGQLGTGAEEALRRLGVHRRWWPRAAAAAGLAVALAGAWWWWDARKAEESGVRGRLEPLARAIPAPDTAPADLDRLMRLAGADDPQVRQGRARLAELEQLRAGLAACEPRLAEAAACAEAAGLLERLALATGNQDPGLQPWRARLAAAALRRELTARLAALDSPRPLPPGIEDDLGRYEALAGFDDPAARGWRTRYARIRQLQTRLEPLTRTASPPAEAAADLAALSDLVGSDDALVAAARTRLAVITARRTPLAEALDHPAPLPTDVAAELDAYAALVGDEDADLRRWRGKVAGWTAAVALLAPLARTWVLDTEGLAAAGQALAAARAIAGDSAVRTWAQRLDELRGPAAPAWAAGRGHDRHGPWLLLRIGDGTQRLRWRPPGTFAMGSPAAEAGRETDEVQVQVRLSRGQWMADSECTQALWQAVMGGNPSRFPDPTRPVEQIDQAEARAFCARLGTLLPGCQARLPSEAEWEAAVRGGGDGAWPGLDPAQAAAAIVHRGHGLGPLPAGERAPGPLGLRDALGNVWEWCAGGYGPQPVGDPVSDPIPPAGELAPVRGGSWADELSACRAANRCATDPGVRSPQVGFRFCVDDAETP